MGRLEQLLNLTLDNNYLPGSLDIEKHLTNLPGLKNVPANGIVILMYS